MAIALRPLAERLAIDGIGVAAVERAPCPIACRAVALEIAQVRGGGRRALAGEFDDARLDDDAAPAPGAMAAAAGEQAPDARAPCDPAAGEAASGKLSSGRAAPREIGGGEHAAEMAPGAALVLLGSTLHGAGANVTGAVRRGLVVGYSLGWLKPYENQWLAYPPAVARKFPPELAALVGYRQHRPNLGNYEGQCPSVLLGDHAGEPLGAIDALRPDQQALVDAYVDERRAAP